MQSFQGTSDQGQVTAAALAGRLEALRRLLGRWRPDPTAPWVLLVGAAWGVALAACGASDVEGLQLLLEQLTLEGALAVELHDLAEPIEAGAWCYRIGPDGELQALRIDAMGADPELIVRPK